MSITLSPKQNEAFDAIMNWYRDEETDKMEFVLAGYAGAGKTSLAKFVKQEIGEEAVFLAYTGKAVNVLRGKGCTPALTIHSAIYALVDHDKQRLRDLKEQLPGLFGFQLQSAQFEIDRLEREYKKPVFEFAGMITDKNLKKAKLLIVDEYSMLDMKIISDLRALGLKILFMGDPFQLPPVNGTCPLTHPDIFLTEIHRQALESAIVRASIDIREGRALQFGCDNDFDFIHSYEIRGDLYTSADQVIVGKNVTRNLMNKQFRQAYGFDHILPVKGDKLICLKNDKKLKIFNGMIGYAMDDHSKQSDNDIAYQLNFNCPDDDRQLTHLRVWEGDMLGQEKDWDGNDYRMKGLQRFTYAYVITCHKSQGSEFGDVVVINEPIGGTDHDRARWLYTAITRGKKKVTLVQP